MKMVCNECSKQIDEGKFIASNNNGEIVAVCPVCKKVVATWYLGDFLDLV